MMLTRASLDYHHAFDLCAALAYHRPEPTYILASSDFYATELRRRLESCNIIWIKTQEDWPDSATTVIWAEPDQRECRQQLEQILATLGADGQVYIITSGWLSRFLPEWKINGGQPCTAPLGHLQTLKHLRHAGFEIQASYGFNGPVLIFWGRLFLLMQWLGWHDRADRALYKMRSVYAVSGALANFTTVRVIKAKPKR